MKNTSHIFFDLDHTLWDFESNSRETLAELIVDFKAQLQRDIDFDIFFFHYTQVNNQLWELYRNNKINQRKLRSVRFVETFEKLNIEQADWMEDFGEAYLRICPKKEKLIDHAEEVLEKLNQSHELHILSNGFAEVQTIKLETSGLKRFFKEVITSEAASAKKPDRRIFDFAIDKAGATYENSAFVGDSYEADVIGGMNAGMPTIYFNPHGKSNPLKVKEIKILPELLGIFQV